MVEGYVKTTDHRGACTCLPPVMVAVAGARECWSLLSSNENCHERIVLGRCRDKVQ